MAAPGALHAGPSTRSDEGENAPPCWPSGGFLVRAVDGALPRDGSRATACYRQAKLIGGWARWFPEGGRLRGPGGQLDGRRRFDLERPDRSEIHQTGLIAVQHRLGAKRASIAGRSRRRRMPVVGPPGWAGTGAAARQVARQEGQDHRRQEGGQPHRAYSLRKPRLDRSHGPPTSSAVAITQWLSACLVPSREDRDSQTQPIRPPGW